MEERKMYGFWTSTALIVGIVIGSGIYFRVDDVLKYTQGNVFLGFILLCLGSIGIIFGGLTLRELTSRIKGSGGLVDYFEYTYGKSWAAGYGWFQLFVYLPSIGIIVSWAASIYIFMLFGYEASLLEQVILSLIINFTFLIINIFSRKMGGFIQNTSTIVKLVPLIVIALAGIYSHLNGTSTVTNLATSTNNLGWLSGLVPIAYSFDGWPMMLSISEEVKGGANTVRRALVVGPLIILVVYVAFYFGMVSLLPVDQIVSLGNNAIFEVSKNVFGPIIGSGILIIIIISILGVSNGLVLTTLRVPQAMATKHALRIDKLDHIHPKYQISLKSGYLVMTLYTIWTIIHFLVMNYNLLGGLDISEISIVFNVLCLGLIFLKIYTITTKKWIVLLAVLNIIVLFVGSLLINTIQVALFISICLLVMLLGIRKFK